MREAARRLWSRYKHTPLAAELTLVEMYKGIDKNVEEYDVKGDGATSSTDKILVDWDNTGLWILDAATGKDSSVRAGIQGQTVVGLAGTSPSEELSTDVNLFIVLHMVKKGDISGRGENAARTLIMEHMIDFNNPYDESRMLLTPMYPVLMKLRDGLAVHYRNAEQDHQRYEDIFRNIYFDKDGKWVIPW